MSIPRIDSSKIFSSLKKTPRNVPTIGVKYVGIIARTGPVRFSNVPKSKKAIPEPSAPRTIVAPIMLKEKVAQVMATSPSGAEMMVEIATTRSINEAGE